MFVQRLFSTFPEGWPGAGLVFLRAVTVISLVQGIAEWTPIPPVFAILQLLAAGAAALLLIGLWTPVAGFIMAAAELSLVLLHAGDVPMHLVLGVLAAAIAMIGPGAWSVDARVFGRKRIRIPQR
jgi:putative oxidoreductase